MLEPEETIVTDKDGVRAVIAAGADGQQFAPSGAGSQVRIWLDDGRQALVPSEALVERQSGGYFLPASLADFPALAPADTAPFDNGQAPAARRESSAAVIVPVVAEELAIDKRVVEAGGVRINKTVRERVETVDEPLAREQVQVERVPIGRVVEGPIAVRHLGDLMIVPVLEEVLVVEKRLMLKEELHITRRRTEVRQPQQVTLRSEEVEVERFDGPAGQDEAAIGEGDMAAFQEGTIKVTEMAEEAVVSKQARVVEEVVVNKEVTERDQLIRDTVRRTDVDVQELHPQAPKRKGNDAQ